MGRIALSQHRSADGVLQSPGPTDVPFKYRRCPPSSGGFDPTPS
jgi:hypothetical protein